MFQDMYLKFTDEAEAASLLYAVVPGVLDEEGNVVTEGSVTPNYRNIDVLGTLYAAAPDPLPENYVPVALEGWHVNVRVLPDEDGSVLEAFSVVPQFPRRVWA